MLTWFTDVKISQLEDTSHAETQQTASYNVEERPTILLKCATMIILLLFFKIAAVCKIQPNWVGENHFHLLPYTLIRKRILFKLTDPDTSISEIWL